MAFAELQPDRQLDALFGAGHHAPLELRSVGDLILHRANMVGVPLIVVAFDPARHQASIGPDEALQLVEVLGAAASQRTPVLFVMNTSGMRVTAGMATVAALRRLYRAALDARDAGLPVFAIVTRYAFGGASMLTALCEARAMHAASQLAMSGPRLIERIAGHDAFDASNRECVRALLGGAARAAVMGSTRLCEDSAEAYTAEISAWLGRRAIATVGDDDLLARHEALKQRLGERALPAPQTVTDLSLPPGALETLRALGCPPASVRMSGSVLISQPPSDDKALVCGLMYGTATTAPAAFALADALLQWAGPAEKLSVTILADTENHSADPADERVVLSEYLFHLASVLRRLHRRGIDVHVVVTGVAGGGIFAALAAGATRVSMLDSARIQVLSAAAMAALDKAADHADETLSSALTAGAVDAVFPLEAPA